MGGGIKAILPTQSAQNIDFPYLVKVFGGNNFTD